MLQVLDRLLVVLAGHDRSQFFDHARLHFLESGNSALGLVSRPNDLPTLIDEHWFGVFLELQGKGDLVELRLEPHSQHESVRIDPTDQSMSLLGIRIFVVLRGHVVPGLSGAERRVGLVDLVLVLATDVGYRQPVEGPELFLVGIVVSLNGLVVGYGIRLDLTGVRLDENLAAQEIQPRLDLRILIVVLVERLLVEHGFLDESVEITLLPAIALEGLAISILELTVALVEIALGDLGIPDLRDDLREILTRGDRWLLGRSRTRALLFLTGCE